MGEVGENKFSAGEVKGGGGCLLCGDGDSKHVAVVTWLEGTGGGGETLAVLVADSADASSALADCVL